MKYIQVSVCPKCGAPLYVESPWRDCLPPPTIRSCQCFRDALQQTIATIDLAKKQEGEKQ